MTKNKFYRYVGCIGSSKCSALCLPGRDNFKSGVHYEVGNSWKTREHVFCKSLIVRGKMPNVLKINGKLFKDKINSGLLRYTELGKCLSLNIL